MFYNPLLPIINMIKRLLYFISKKIFILLLIIIFLAFFIILSFINESKATDIYYNTGEVVVDDIILPSLPNDLEIYDWLVLTYIPTHNIYVVRGGMNDSRDVPRIFNDGSRNFLRYSDTMSVYDCDLSNSSLYWHRTTSFPKDNLGTQGITISNASTYDWGEIIVYSTKDIGYIFNDNIFFNKNWNYYWQTLPYIQTPTASIENWSFNDFIIKGNIDILEENSTARHTLQLKLIVNDYTYTQFITYDQLTFDNDIIENGESWTISIPKNLLFNDLFNSESNLLNRNFVLSDLDTTTDYDLGTFDITLTQQQLNDINGQNNFNNQQQLQQDINNPNISSDFNNSSGGGFRDFSNGMNITDNTSINDMFNMIYNAFTHDYTESQTYYSPHELEITFPLMDYSLKISPYTVFGRNWYTESDNTAITIVKTFANLFWWYFIGSYIIKDIRSIINQVAEGNVENVGSDVKKELL